MRKPTGLVALTMVLVLCLGCGHHTESASDELANRQQGILVDNGQEHNSPELTGTREHITYVDLTRGTLDGVPLKGVSLQSEQGRLMEITADHPSGAKLGASALVGAQFDAVTEGGRTVRARIEGAYASPSEGYEYGVSVQAGSDAWQRLCPAGLAIAVRGYWDSRGDRVEDWQRMTLACRNSAVYKCARNFKLSPGASSEDTAYHQACVRMIRGDYCGDGITHTLPGVLIDAYDRRGTSRSQEPANGKMTFEAAWTPRGAYCLENPRFDLDSSRPENACALRLPRCGLKDFTSFDLPSGVLWMNRSHYRPLPPPEELVKTEAEERVDRKMNATQCRLFGTSCDGLPPKSGAIPAASPCKPGSKLCASPGLGWIDEPAPTSWTPVYPAASYPPPLGKPSRWQ